MKTPSILHYVRNAALAVLLLAASSAAHAAAFTWVGASSSASWGSSTNWSNNVVPTFDNTADLEFPSSAVAQTNTALGTARTVRSLSFGSGVTNAMFVNLQDFSFGNGTNLTMAADSNNASITVATNASGNITVGTNSANGNTAGDFGLLVLATNLNVVHNGTGQLLFNRAITKTGTGTMVLGTINTSPNTFTGDININEGTLIANGNVAATDMNNAAMINLGGGVLDIRNVSGANKTYSNVGFLVSALSTLIYNNTGSSSFTLTFSGTNVFALNTNLVVSNSTTNTALTNFITISRNITGSGNLTNIGYNNITTNTNNYNFGRLSLSGTNTNWNGNLVVARGTANLGGTGVNAPGGNGTIFIGTTGDSFGAGVGTFFGTNVVPLNGNIFISNNLTIRSGGFRSLRPAGDHIMNFLGDITLEGTLNVDSALNFYTDKWINLLGDISGAGGLSVTRTAFGGHIELGGSNSYLGTTTISSSATLQVNSPSGQAIPDTSAVTISGPIVTNGAHVFIPTLRLLTSETIASLAAADAEARLVFSNNAVLTTGGDNSSTTYAGTSIGAGGLTKTGTGTMTLDGAIAHAGTTTVSAGQIVFATNGSLTFTIGCNGTNTAVTGSGSALFQGSFNINLASASLTKNDLWTLVSVLSSTNGAGFTVTGFTNNSGIWTFGTNGATYQFNESSDVLMVTASPYDNWVTYWQGLYSGFTNITPGNNPDGDPYVNSAEFAFDGNPDVGSPSFLTAVKTGTNSTFSWVARNVGVTYEVQGTTNLSVGPWTNTTGITITNSLDQSGISQTNYYTRKEFVIPATGSGFTRVQATFTFAP